MPFGEATSNRKHASERLFHEIEGVGELAEFDEPTVADT
jgi:hypothetical protein